MQPRSRICIMVRTSGAVRYPSSSRQGIQWNSVTKETGFLLMGGLKEAEGMGMGQAMTIEDGEMTRTRIGLGKAGQRVAAIQKGGGTGTTIQGSQTVMANQMTVM